MARPALTKAKRRKIEVALDSLNLNKSLTDAGLVGHTLKEIHIQSPGVKARRSFAASTSKPGELFASD